MIKIIFTDLDGVIRFWDTEDLHRCEEKFSLEKNTVYKISFEKELYYNG